MKNRENKLRKKSLNWVLFSFLFLFIVVNGSTARAQCHIGTISNSTLPCNGMDIEIHYSCGTPPSSQTPITFTLWEGQIDEDIMGVLPCPCAIDYIVIDPSGALGTPQTIFPGNTGALTGGCTGNYDWTSVGPPDFISFW